MSTEEQGSNHRGLNRRNVLLGSTTLAAAFAFSSVASVRTAQAQQQQQQPAAPTGSGRTSW
jgi:invasion protein IalB